MAEEEKKISVYDDKYTFFMKNHSLHCLRYGEEWRDFIGDGAVLQLFLHALELEEQNKALRRPAEVAGFKSDGFLAVGQELINRDQKIEQLEALLDAKQKIITEFMKATASTFTKFTNSITYCKRHNTYPEEDEPCWACMNERDGVIESVRLAILAAVEEKPVLICNSVLLDWADRLDGSD